MRLILASLFIVAAAAGELSPAGKRIEAITQQLAAQPATQAEPRLRTELAMAYARRARETSDPSFYERGQAEVKRALALAPNDFEALKAQTWLSLGQHEFAEAYKQATLLNKRAPDDVQVYGMLADACNELGKYEEAEKAVQWMLDLRPGNVPALTRTAYLREIWGDYEGALMVLDQAFRATPATQTEDRAWIATHMARVFRLNKKYAEADRTLQAALKLFPEYHYALYELAELRTAEGRHADAVVLLERRLQLAPHPENVAHLAAALDRAGRTEEAGLAWTKFVPMARKEMEGWDNANRELIDYYLTRGDNRKEALRLATQEYSRRKHHETVKLYERALEANGKTRDSLTASGR